MSGSSPKEIKETEKQLWNIIRMIPGLNVTYGSVRCIVYVMKKDKEESISTAIDVTKGATQVAGITGGVLAAPVTVPVGVGALTGIAVKSVIDGVEVLMFFVMNSDQLQGKSPSEKESIFYDKIKDVSLIGALYSAARVPVYIIKKNRQKSAASAVNMMTNLGDTGVQVGVDMIPGIQNIDPRLQKAIKTTARHAMHLSGKLFLQQEHVAAAKAAVESSSEAIMEMEIASNPNDDVVQPKKRSCHCHSQKLLCCALTRCRYQCRGNKDKATSDETNENNAHLIILTE